MNSLYKILMVAVVVAMPASACKEKEQKKPAPTTTANPTDPNDPNNTAPAIAIEVVGQTGTTFQFPRGQIVQLQFRITGTSAQSNLISALSEMPTGGQLTGPNTSEPVFTWTALQDGTVYVTLLVRDMDACTRSGATDCAINPAQYGSIVPNSSYDVTQRYTLTIGASSVGGNGQVGNQITDGGGSGGGGFLSNALGGIGNVFGGIGSFVSNMGSSIWQFIVGLFS